MTILVGLADDHPVLLAGIEALINGSDIKVVGSSHDTESALSLGKRLEPDVFILDINIPGNAVKAITQLATMNGGKTKVIVFTAERNVEVAIAALEAGASGYVLKESAICELIEGIRSAAHGQTFISPSFASQVVTGLRLASQRRKAQRACKFSVREEQVLRLLMRGPTNKEIAEVLTISDKTVKHYVGVIMQKLNVRNRIEVVLAAQKMGMTSDGDGIGLMH